MAPVTRHVLDTKEILRLYFSLATSRTIQGRTPDVPDGLDTEITLLKGRVCTVMCDEDLPMDLCEATLSTVSCPTSDERTARLELIKAKEEVHQANVSFGRFKVAYRSLASM